MIPVKDRQLQEGVDRQPLQVMDIGAGKGVIAGIRRFGRALAWRPIFGREPTNLVSLGCS